MDLLTFSPRELRRFDGGFDLEPSGSSQKPEQLRVLVSRNGGGACVFLLTAQHAGGNDGAPCGRCFRGVAGASPPLHCVSGDLSFFGDDEVGRAQLSSLSRPSSNQVASSRSAPPPDSCPRQSPRGSWRCCQSWGFLSVLAKTQATQTGGNVISLGSCHEPGVPCV